MKRLGQYHRKFSKLPLYSFFMTMMTDNNQSPAKITNNTISTKTIESIHYISKLLLESIFD